MVAPVLAGDYAYCDDLVRRDDPDRWLASLFAPQLLRPHLVALYAFSLEIARARQVVTEPTLGEIRFQWWRDLFEGLVPVEVKGHPVASALLDTVARHRLRPELLIRLIDARLFDLYDDPMPSRVVLESYARDTASVLFQMAATILDPDAAKRAAVAAEHAGIAYAITGLLRALPWHAPRGQVYLPLDLLSEHGLVAADIAAGRALPGLVPVLAELRALARRHLASMRESMPARAGVIAPAFLPARLCEPYLRQMEKPGYDPFRTAVGLPKWRRQWILWRAA
jgi:phytoene synthase